MTFDTVEIDTPAFFATSLIVTDIYTPLKSIINEDT